MDLAKTNFRALWIKILFDQHELDAILDTGASAHNVISKKLAEKLGLKPEYCGNKVTTIGNEEVNISKPMKLSFKINGFTQEQPFVVVDTDIDFVILGCHLSQPLRRLT